MKRCAIVAAALLASQAAQAQYPSRPIRMVVPILAGGPLDNVARITAQALGQVLGQPLVVENRPGADGAIGAQAVMSAAADGYTLFFPNNTAIVGVPLLNPDAKYSGLTDFTPVSFVGRMTLVIYANNDVPGKSLADVVNHARANPGKLSYATSTIGDVIAGAQLLNTAGISLLRVPYKGAAQAIPDLIAGRVQLAIAPVAAGMAHAKAGKLRMLAVILPTRSPAALEVPTTTETGFPGLSVTTWAAIFGPRGMPGEISARLSSELERAMQRADVREQYDRQGFRAESSTPEALAEILKREIATWSRIIKENNITNTQ